MRGTITAPIQLCDTCESCVNTVVQTSSPSTTQTAILPQLRAATDAFPENHKYKLLHASRKCYFSTMFRVLVVYSYNRVD